MSSDNTVYTGRATPIVYCDFYGVISPRMQPVGAISNVDEADVFPIDRHTPNDVRWSSELIDELRALINGRHIAWHWLVSDPVEISSISDQLGFDRHKVIIEELAYCHADDVVTLRSKPDIIHWQMTRSWNDGRVRPIIWIDDQYAACSPELTTLDNCAKKTGTPMLMITPTDTVGLTRNHLAAIKGFALTDRHPVGITTI